MDLKLSPKDMQTAKTLLKGLQDNTLGPKESADMFLQADHSGALVAYITQRYRATPETSQSFLINKMLKSLISLGVSDPGRYSETLKAPPLSHKI